MDVRFDSNSNGRDIGFTLDARSTSCDYGVKEVRIAAGEVLEDALVSDTDSDGLYPNNAWQKWNIITDESQVNIWFQRKSTYKLFFSMSTLQVVFCCMVFLTSICFSVLSSLWVMEVLLQSQNLIWSCLKIPAVLQV